MSIIKEAIDKGFYDYFLSNLKYRLENVDGKWCQKISDTSGRDFYETRPIEHMFFQEIEDMLYNTFQNYIKKAKVVHTIIFIVLQCLLLIYYIIIWRRYYITVKVMVKKSQELINLIPEEIKYIMVEKINE